MSLIQKIATRRFEDIINQGFRFAFTGSVGTVTDQALWTGATDRSVVTTGFILSTTSATDVLVSLGYKTGIAATVVFFQGNVKSGAPIVYNYMTGDERYSNCTDSLVITTGAAGPVIYTVNGRIIGDKISLGYIEREGAPAHSGGANYPPFNPPTNWSGFSGADRGGYPG